MSVITTVQKRDGQRVPFDLNRITNAIDLAMKEAKQGSFKEANLVSEKVLTELEHINARFKNFMPDVEGVQDMVENMLIKSEYGDTAKRYILYRDEQKRKRAELPKVPEHVRALAEASKKYFRNTLSEFVYLRTYARWIPDEHRRETWIETVDRYIEFMRGNLGGKLTGEEYEEIREAILRQEVMPSMRLLQFAGEAARVSNVCAYNCSYIAPTCIRDFAEVMYISMCGTGVGFSVESQNVQALPQIRHQNGQRLDNHVVGDSKEGWCDALIAGMEAWFGGKEMDFDFTQVRPAGARLKTIGGKSSGPEPLRALLDFTRSKILAKQGRRLSNLDAHDVLCKIGEIVVAGGVRRSAMISLSDIDDQPMRDAKRGQFYYMEPQRCIANNSAVYQSKPTTQVLLDEWLALIKSGSGERGIFNRAGLGKTLPQRRLDLLRDKGLMRKDRITGLIGTNPCGEIILQSKQFCNLSEVVARADDSKETLLRKVRLAALLGTYQATLTDFPYLSKEWRNNCEQERLLGVSVTGQWDCDAARDPEVLAALKVASIKANEEFSERFAVNASTCVTCVKPSGTVSQTVDCASGMHPRHADYYIRRVRISATDALFKMLKAQGVPYQPEVGQSMDNATTYVVEFPVKAPEGAIVAKDVSALEQLAHWKMVKEEYTEHNPSVTISVGEDEWIAVVNWVYENWDIVGGLSFLPRSNHVYQLAPYETIDETRYTQMKQSLGEIDFSQIVRFEEYDQTEVKRELACAGGLCEL
jgi:ribonucleoside-triphosphate reductase (thioredoxin)